MNCRGARDQPTGLVEQHRSTVEDELVLPSDEVHVQDRHRGIGRSRRQHRFALVDAAGVVGRSVDVHHQLGPTRRLRRDGTGRAPCVFADRDRDPHTAHDEQWPVVGGRREVPRFVEHRVVREQVLAVDPLHATVRADRRRVGEVPSRLREADHGRGAAGVGGELVERLSAAAPRTPAGGADLPAGTR